MVGSRSTVETKLGSSAACLAARRRVLEKKRLLLLPLLDGRDKGRAVVVERAAAQHWRAPDCMLLRIGCCSRRSMFLEQFIPVGEGWVTVGLAMGLVFFDDGSSSLKIGCLVGPTYSTAGRQAAEGCPDTTRLKSLCLLDNC